MTNISRFPKVLKLLPKNLPPIHQKAYILNSENRKYKKNFPFEATLEQDFNQRTELSRLKWRVEGESQSGDSLTEKFSSLINHTKQVKVFLDESNIFYKAWDMLGEELKLMEREFARCQYYEKKVIPVMGKLLEEVEKETHNGINSEAYGQVVSLFKIFFYTFHPNRKIRSRKTQD